MHTSSQFPFSPSELAELFQTTAENLWHLLLADSATYASSVGQRMRTPVVGDLVVEMTSFLTPALKRVGRLEAVTEETLADPAQGTHTVYTLRAMDGQMLRWSDCRFICLPERTPALLSIL